MFAAIGSRGIGKTKFLIEEAVAHDGIIVCANPRAMEQKIKAYGYGNQIKCIQYRDLFIPGRNREEKIYIDDLDMFALHTLGSKLQGYSLTIGDN